MSSLELIAQKLGHPLAEVRARSLQALDFKIKYGLISCQDLLQERPLLKALIRLVNMGEGVVTTGVVLLLLRKLAAMDRVLGRALLECGALQELQRLKDDCPRELAAALDAVMDALQRPREGAVARGVTACSTASAARGLHGAEPQPPWACSASSAANEDSSPCRDSAAAALAADGDGAGGSDTAASSRLGTPAVLDSLDARALRAQARADWRLQEGLAGAGATFVGGPVPLTWPRLLLREVAVGAADDQALFEANVRLQYSQDERMVLPTLKDLAYVLAADFPAEVFLARPSILDNTLALLAMRNMSAAVHDAAAAALLALVAGVKRSLALAAHPEYARSVCGGGPAPHAAQLAAPRTRPQPEGSGRPCLHATPPGAVQSQGGACSGMCGDAWPAAGSDPTCPVSYPLLPSPPAGVPGAWVALPTEEAPWLDVTASVELAMLHVLDLLRHPDRHWQLLPIAEALLPLVAAPLAHVWSPGGAGVSTAVSDAPAEAVAHYRAVWGGMLAALTRAMASSMAVAKAERAAALQGQPQQHANAMADAAAQFGPASFEASLVPGEAVWDLSSAAVLQLALRLLHASPPEWCAPDVVNPVLADAIADAALDEAVAAQLPGLRAAALPVLARLRPAALEALHAADGVSAALGAAAGVEAGLKRLAGDPRGHAAEWMTALGEALPGLGFGAPSGQGGATTRMVAVALQGLALVAGACTSDAATVDSAAAAAVHMLDHPSHEVTAVAHALLPELLTAVEPCQSGSASADRVEASLKLLTLPSVLEHLTVRGLAQPHTRAAAAAALMAMLGTGSASAAAAVLRWQAWVEAWAVEPEVAPLAEALEEARMLASTARHKQGLLGWTALAAPLRRLFAREGGLRQAAARELRRLGDACGSAGGAAYMDRGQGDSHHEDDDPLRGLLEVHPRPEPLFAASAQLVANFRGEDATNLLRVLHNDRLALELRRSAAEQLAQLAGAPNLLAAMTTPAQLQALWSLAAVAFMPGEDDADENNAATCNTGAPACRAHPRHAHPGAADKQQQGRSRAGGWECLEEVQLPVAALGLLAVLAARDTHVRRWLMSDSDRLLLPFLPLVFHSLHSVRRATGRLLSVLALAFECEVWSGFMDASGGGLLPPGASEPRVPALLLASFQPPFAVMALVTDCDTSRDGAPSWADGELVRVGGVPGGGQPSGAPKPGPSHGVLQRLVHQQRLFRTAGNDPAAALQLLDADAATACLPPPLAAATASTLRVLSAPPHARSLLAALASADSHAAATAALVALQRLGSTAAGMAAVASCDWLAAMQRLLSVAPMTEDDGCLWSALLPFAEHLLGASPLAPGAYAQLARVLSGSAVAWLQQPGVARDAVRPLPLALAPLHPGAAAAAALDREAGSDEIGAACCVEVTQAVLRLLIRLTRCARQRCPLPLVVQELLPALHTPMLLAALAGPLVGAAEGVHPGCRLLAASLLAELLEVVAEGRLVQGMQPSVPEQYTGDVLSYLDPLISGVAMPAAAAGRAHASAAGGGPGSTGFRGKALLRAALRALQAAVRALPTDTWAPVWAQIGGTFWLSRLSRDREACIRAACISLLASLLAPGAAPTQRMLQSGWPDAGPRMLRVALDGWECEAVRAAALRFLVASAGVASATVDAAAAAAHAAATDSAAATELANTRPQGLHRFGLAALLQQQPLWEQLPALLEDDDATPPLRSAAAAAALLAAAVDIDGHGRQLLQAPGAMQALLRMVTPHAMPQACEQYLGLVDQTGSGCELMDGTCPPEAAPLRGVAAVTAHGSGHPAASIAAAAAAAPPVRRQRVAWDAAGACAAACALQTLALAAREPKLLAGAPASEEVLAALPSALCSRICAAAAALPQWPAPAKGFDPAALWVVSGSVEACAQQLASLEAAAVAQNEWLQRQEGCADGSGPAGSHAGATRALELGAGGSFLVAAALGLLHPQTSDSTKRALACLVGTLTADRATARQLLGCPAHAVQSPDLQPQDPDFQHGDDPQSLDAADEGDTGALEPQIAPGVPVGSALCAALAQLVPDACFAAGAPDAAAHDAAGESHDGGVAQAGPGLAACGEEAVPMVALRNVLTYSAAAKATAVEMSLHRVLLDFCAAHAATLQSMGAALMAAEAADARRAAAASAGPSMASIKQAARAPRGGTKTGSAAVGGSVAVARLARTWGGVSSFSSDDGPGRALGSPRPPRGPPSSAGARSRAASPPPRTSASKGSIRLRASSAGVGGGSGSSSSARAALPDPPPAPRDVASDSQALPPLPDLPDAAAPPATSPRASPRRSGAGPAASAAAQHREQLARLQRRVCVALAMLRQLAFGHAPTKRSLAEDGVMDVTLLLWPAALQQPALLHELLALLANMMPGCLLARSALASLCGPSTSMLSGLLALLWSADTDAHTWTGAARAAAHFACEADGAGALVCAGSSFLADALKLVDICVNQRDWPKLAATLQLLACVAAHASGQRAMLRPAAAPGVLDAAVQALEAAAAAAAAAATTAGRAGGQAAAPLVEVANAALLLLRNLAFADDMRAPALAQRSLLPLLLAAAESVLQAPPPAAAHREVHAPGSSGWTPALMADAAACSGGVAGLGSGGNVCGAAYAASALWALMHQGEKLKAAVRKLPRSRERVVAARATAAWLRRRLPGGASAGDAAAVQVGSVALLVVRGASLIAGGAAGSRSVGWWLRELEANLCAVGELLAPGGGTLRDGDPHADAHA